MTQADPESGQSAIDQRLDRLARTLREALSQPPVALRELAFPVYLRRLISEALLPAS